MFQRKLKIFFIIILAVLSASIFGVQRFAAPMDASDATVTNFVVNPGDTTNTILDNLEEQGFIRNTTMARLYVRLSNHAHFFAGTFHLSKNMSMPHIIQTLNTATTSEETTLTIREGLRVVDVAALVEANLGIDAAEFKALTNDQEFINELAQDFPIIAHYDFNNDMLFKLEGLLAPDTYRLSVNATARDVIRTLVGQSNRIYKNHLAKFEASHFTIKEIFTLASMVESEVHTKEQREIVASIFANRIEQHMSLGSDVTTYYGIQLHMGERELTVAELNQRNAYNTRAPGFLGLPAGPVSSPSLMSIEAVLDMPNTNYLFFVNDKNGEIYPTSTYEQHAAVIARLQRDGLWYDDIRDNN